MSVGFLLEQQSRARREVQGRMSLGFERHRVDYRHPEPVFASHALQTGANRGLWCHHSRQDLAGADCGAIHNYRRRE